MPITANGQTYSDDQIKNFFASAPTNDAVAKQAASMGLNQNQIQQAMQIGGQNVSTGDITDYASKNGYSWGPSGGLISNAAGNTPAAPTVSPSLGYQPYSSSSSSSYSSASPGNWQVSEPQTVSGQFNNLISSGNPLIQKARTQALEQMNGRGLINSSMALTAGDSAAYDAALQIAKPDAATYADAARTNANAQTSASISAANNATSRDINAANNANSAAIAAANAAAQKELIHANQLYSNLTSQTASANTIQTWGLNTITSIMGSDMSAEAKDAAVGQVKSYLTDSYQIQGEWHTSAAQAIDAIFG